MTMEPEPVSDRDAMAVALTIERRDAASFPALKIKDIYGIEQNDYQVNMGRCIDTLKADYPLLLREEPRLSIYSENILLKDASSAYTLEGKAQYQRLFTAMRFLRNSTVAKDEITYRLLVNDNEIRVRWHAKLWIHDPRTALPGIFAPDEPPVVIVDGVSVYEVNAKGYIHQHTLDDVVITPSTVQESFNRLLSFAWPRATSSAVPVPASPLGMAANLPGAPPTIYEAAAVTLANAASGSSSLRAAAPRRAQRSVATASEQAAEQAGPAETPMSRAARERTEDAEKARQLEELRSPKVSRCLASLAHPRPFPPRLQRRNLFTPKSPLTPLTPLTSLLSPTPMPQERTPGLLATLGGEALDFFGLLASAAPQGCETNFDCDRPMVCCDLNVFGASTRICCSNGQMANSMAPQMVPIPVPVEDSE